MLVGRAVGSLVGATAGWAGIAFLFLAGLLLLRPGNDEEATDRRLRLLAHTRGLAIIDLGLGISVDELTIGLSAGLLALPIAFIVVWIALSKAHFGIHGTSDPDSIGYASSHGCVRLANWDAQEVSHRIAKNVQVEFLDTQRTTQTASQ